MDEVARCVEMSQGVGGVGKWIGPSGGGRMAAFRIFRAGRWVSLVGFVRIVHFVAIWGLIFVTCPWCFRYLQFMVFAISDRLCVGYLNS